MAYVTCGVAVVQDLAVVATATHNTRRRYDGLSVWRWIPLTCSTRHTALALHAQQLLRTLPAGLLGRWRFVEGYGTAVARPDRRRDGVLPALHALFNHCCDCFA